MAALTRSHLAPLTSLFSALDPTLVIPHPAVFAGCGICFFGWRHTATKDLNRTTFFSVLLYYFCALPDPQKMLSTMLARLHDRPRREKLMRVLIVAVVVCLFLIPAATQPADAPTGFDDPNNSLTKTITPP